MPRLPKRKEKEPEELLPRLLMPSHIRERPDHIAVNERLNRVLIAVGYPRLVELGFLDRVIRAKGDFDISLHIQPASLDAIRFRLNRLIVKQKADLIAAEAKGVDAPSLRILYEDTLGLLRQVERGEEKVFDAGLYINIKGKKPEELDLLTAKVKAELDGIGVVSRQPTFRMRDGLQCMLPLATDRLKALRTMTTSALAECFPFTSSYLDAEAGGIIVATNRDTGVPIIRDVYALTNPNIMIAGTSGGGKSYFAKLLMARQAMRDVRTMVVDPNGEYGRIVRALGGEEVDISRTSDTMINVFDLMGYPLDEKRLSLMDALALMLGKLTTPQRAALAFGGMVMAEKAAASWQKCSSSFRVWPAGVGLGLLTALLPFSPIVFAMPGFSWVTGRRLTVRKLGRVALAGPVFALVLGWLCFFVTDTLWTLYGLPGTMYVSDMPLSMQAAFYTAQLALMLAALWSLPWWSGQRIWQYSKPLGAALLALAGLSYWFIVLL